jgi:3-hydroxyisobutyrate dehydrogenase-like beta-hydroxyacid dehydrogenase
MSTLKLVVRAARGRTASGAHSGCPADSDHPGWFAPALALKDVRLAIGLAEEAGVPARIGPATEQLLTGVLDTGDRWQDFAAVIEALRPRAGGAD